MDWQQRILLIHYSACWSSKAEGRIHRVLTRVNLADEPLERARLRCPCRRNKLYLSRWCTSLVEGSAEEWSYLLRRVLPWLSLAFEAEEVAGQGHLLERAEAVEMAGQARAEAVAAEPEVVRAAAPVPVAP